MDDILEIEKQNKIFIDFNVPTDFENDKTFSFFLNKKVRGIVYRGDITSLNVDVIVNAANK